MHKHAHLPYLSRISPVSLPCLSPISPPSLPFISLAELCRFLMHKRAHRTHAARRTPGAAACVLGSLEARRGIKL